MTESAQPRAVIVVDDDPRIRTALAELLAADDGFDLVGEADDARSALRLASEHDEAMVLVDVRMAGGGPALVRALTDLPHRPLVVGLSANSDAASWTSMLAAGAAGYLLKGALAADLTSLLRRCAAGELVVAVPGAVEVVRRLLDKPR